MNLVARVLITKARSNNILLAENVVEQILVPISWVGELESIKIRDLVLDNLIGNKELFEKLIFLQLKLVLEVVDFKARNRARSPNICNP